MGDVYRAVEQASGRVVALKLLRRASGRAILHFKREFRVVSRLIHPNLATLYELHRDGERWFFTMELVEGGVPFIDWVRPPPRDAEPPLLSATITEDHAPTVAPTSPAGPAAAPAALDVPRLRAALAQLADGMIALHSCNKLHRDLKPSNVLVRPDGRVVLLDFGLAFDLDRANALDAGTSVSGTPAYMSPEQASLAPLSRASDWYAFGVMLYEALTGERPFKGSTHEILRAKQELVPRPPSALVPEVPPDLEALCMRLLSRSPADRANAREVLAVLGSAPSAATTARERGAAGPLGGRLAELDELQRALADAAEHGVTLFLSGESGIGKTRLIREFLAETEGDVVVLDGRCYDREAVPYRALDTVVDALAAELLRRPAASVAAMIPAGVEAAVRLFPVLRQVPAIAQRRDDIAASISPQELRGRAFDGLRGLLAGLGTQSQIVLVIDDLQWGDADSAVFLADLAHHPGTLRLLCILAHRNEPGLDVVAQVRAASPDLARGDIRTIELGPLSPADALELAQELGAEGEAVASLARDAGGHPLFLAELLQTREHDDAPPTLDRLIGRRVARLSAGAAAVLRAAAVAARPMPLERVARVAGLSDAAAEIALLRSERLATVTQSSSDESLLETYHDRVRSGVVASMSPALVRSVHEALAQDYEQHAAGDVDAIVVHWLGAERFDRAASHATEAARAAEAGLAFHRAANLYGVALRHGAAGVERQRTLQRKQADMLAYAGRFDEAASAYGHAAALSEGDDALDAERLRLEQLLRAGNLRAGLEHGRRLLRRVGVAMPTTHAGTLLELGRQRILTRLRGLGFVERDAREVPRETLRHLDFLSSVSQGLGLVEPALGLIAQAHFLRAALDAGEPHHACIALANETAYLAQGGARNQRRIDELSARARALADRLGTPDVVAHANSTAGLVCMQLGEWKRARDLLARAILEGAKSAKARWIADTSEHFHMTSLFYRGDTAELARLTPIRLRAAIERGDVYAQRGLRGWRSNLTWLIEGRPDLARAHVEAAEAGIEPTNRMQMRDYFALVTNVRIDHYLGERRQAFQRVERVWPMLRASNFLRVQSIRQEVLFVRATTVLGEVMAVGARAGRAQLRVVRRLIKELERDGVAWAAGFIAQLEATAAYLEGDARAAASWLRTAEQAYVSSDMSLYASVTRLRAAMLDGDVPAAEATRALLRAGAIVEPDALAEAIFPWPNEDDLRRRR